MVKYSLHNINLKKNKNNQKQNEVINSINETFTAISLTSYYKTTGLVMRSSGKTTLIGYCVESPEKTLEILFKDFHITCYKEYNFFSSSDFEPTTPVLGLKIEAIEPPKIYGIEYNGKLEELIELNKLIKAKRETPISQKDVKRIIDYLKEEELNIINPNYEQYKSDKQNLINIIKKFE